MRALSLICCLLGVICVHHIAGFNRCLVARGGLGWPAAASATHHNHNYQGTRLQALEVPTRVEEEVKGGEQRLEAFIQEKFIAAVRAALQGDATQLSQLTASADSASPWDNPFVATMAEAKEGLRQLSSFFLDPRLTVFSVGQLGPTRALVEYQLSFTYPLPWRPRVVIHAKAAVTTNAELTQVVSVAERWDNSVFDLFRKQVLPRLWDIWHLFASPVPEYPPLKHLGSIGKVTFAEFPPAVVYEARWSGLAKYPGPPLQILPGFSFIGQLQTSKPNRDPFYTILPVETNSDSFLCPATQREMKRTSWILPVPSAFHHLVLPLAREAQLVTIPPSDIDFSDASVDDQDPDTTDVKVNNLDNVNVMRSVTGGVQRGAALRFDERLVEEFRQSEQMEYRYRVTPRRFFAQAEVAGDVTPDKISAALAEIRAVVRSQTREILASRMLTREGAAATAVALKRRSMDASRAADDAGLTPQIGLLLSNCKACFNAKGEPAMAVYEIQFNNKVTRVQVELEPQW